MEYTHWQIITATLVRHGIIRYSGFVPPCFTLQSGRSSKYRSVSRPSLLYRGRHFWKIARINAHWIFASSVWTEKKLSQSPFPNLGLCWGLGLCWTDSFNIRLLSSVVTVGVRPVGLHFKIIPSSRNVLALRVMQFWDSVWESSSCSPVQVELATKLTALVPQQFYSNDRLDTERYLLNRPHGRVTQSDI